MWPLGFGLARNGAVRNDPADLGRERLVLDVTLVEKGDRLEGDKSWA
jgi:hypothetical protein